MIDKIRNLYRPNPRSNGQECLAGAHNQSAYRENCGGHEKNEGPLGVGVHPECDRKGILASRAVRPAPTRIF